MKLAIKIVKILDKILTWSAGILLLLMLMFSLYSLWDMKKINDRAFLPDDLLEYKPSKSKGGTLSLEELKKINADVVGWIDIHDTHIDYPIFQGKDNIEYTNKDVYGKFSFSGSIFLDVENNKNFTDSYNMLYGHNMANGGMFGDVNKFSDKDFFDSHSEGELFTITKSYTVSLFAILKTDAGDPLIFEPSNFNEANQDRLIEYIKDKSELYRDIDLANTDKLVALSTCYDTKTNGRTVLFGKMEEN